MHPIEAFIRNPVKVTVAVLLLFGPVSASAEEENLKDGAKKAGHAMGSAVREIGRGAKKAGKTVGQAAKEGGKEFHKAIKGESK